MLFYRFDEECRAQVADNMRGRGVHIYSETTPIKYAALHTPFAVPNLAPHMLLASVLVRCCGAESIRVLHIDVGLMAASHIILCKVMA